MYKGEAERIKLKDQFYIGILMSDVMSEFKSRIFIFHYRITIRVRAVRFIVI